MRRNTLFRFFRCLREPASAVALVTVLFSATGGAQPAPDAGDALSALDRAAASDERVWLDTGNGKDLAFYLSEKSGRAHGGVLIVPEPGVHPAARGNINALRHALAQNHWHTLAIDIDGLDAAAIQRTIAAGVAYLNSQGIYNVALFGQGQGAAHALHYAAALPPAEKGGFQQIRALLMFNADNNTPDLGADPMAPLAKLSMPVFDAWFTNDFQEQQQAARRRSLAAVNNPLYQQTRVPYTPVMSPDLENRITKRFRGWLDNNVAGFMVDRNKPAPAAR